ncbi:unnamed protein product [Rotaria sp. Silwood1]|nr:unnamed protein product [Rotaria sp. Silwood1]CAF4894237.1 unnamed protein product [Rotaria sp. Silwood1]CAF4917981.1 unnamed protein product [Rotaria sp. Silwood1]
MIPSVLCSMYLFYQFARLRVLRVRVDNHIVLLLLIINFIQRFLGAMDWIGNLTITVTISILGSILLVIRVIGKRLRIVHNFSWRRNRRMVIQLLSISVFYIIIWVPIIVCFLMVLYAPNPIVLNLSVSYLNYYQYICMLLYPLICLTGLKEAQKPLKQQFYRWAMFRTNNNRIQPTGT